MRYAVFSDVHSNLEALEAVLQALQGERVDQLLCAGDSVGYGADPATCLELLERSVHHMVCGNHDLAVADRMDLDWFNKPAQAAALWTRAVLPSERRRYFKELPLVWKDSQVTLVHGSLNEPEQFHYVLDAEAALKSLRIQETPVAFIGHTHLPGAYIEEGGRVTFHRFSRMEVPPSGKLLVNVGSVGQPRDGDPRAAYCIYDSQAGELSIRRLPYPIAQAQAKIRKAGLPELFADRLAHGY
ncbi:MAG: metallophosphoesterase family protein [Candidatus Omnitrophica bacterium]|nr:metallophosphoesterase family protein [Candidatus Omnitrophota bacterium]